MANSPTTFIRGPNQAEQIFGVTGAPRQRHVFLVRFVPIITYSADEVNALTFAVKHCDRPKVTIKNETMNQYNKKRQIYTGFTLDPIKITFYDGSDGAAQDMWAKYSRYYFGDFTDETTTSSGAYSYTHYDITTDAFFAGNGYGLTETYAGAPPNDLSPQWFFSRIVIYHFYDQRYDSYILINPRITNYEPDELDYENCTVSQITMSLVYENLQYSTGMITNDIFPEFNLSGVGLAGANLPVAGAYKPVPNTLADSTLTPSNPSVDSLLANITSATPAAVPYRADAVASTGALDQYGDFSFGIPSTPNPNAASPPSAMQVDLTGASVDAALNTQYGTASSTLTQAATTVAQTPVAAPAATAGGKVAFTDWDTPAPAAPAISVAASGTTLSPAALTAVNTQQTGTAQYGFNFSSPTATAPGGYPTAMF